MRPPPFLALVFHLHQPAAVSDDTVRAACDAAYAPLLALLAARPAVRATLHLSGALIDRLEALRPELVDRVADLAARGQVELLGGGYHDPILPLLPEVDRLAQVERLGDRLERRFGVRPTGAWLAERVYDPTLIPLLAEAGIDYVPLDDGHFRPLGMQPRQLRGAFVCEEGGSLLRVLPGSARLRYALPFRPVDEACALLEETAREATGGVVTVADDAEKYGYWPGTEGTAAPGGWLDRFLGRILGSPADGPSGGVRFATLGEAVRSVRPLGRAELPAGAYPELLEWSLPAEAAVAYRQFTAEAVARGDAERPRRFFAVGHFRNFLTRYPEADALHKRSLRVSALVNSLRRSPKRARALELLHRAEGGDVYWHGVFPGIYDPGLRRAAWRDLIEAESLAAPADAPYVAGSEEDLDLDGLPELFLESDRFGLTVKPDLGGAITGLDDRLVRLNLLDTMSRRPEGYHAANGGDGPYDWHRKAALIDHFLDPDASAEAVAAESFRDRSDFTLGLFRYGVRRTKARLEATLERSGVVETPRGLLPHTLQKRIILEAGSDRLRFEWMLRNDSMEAADHAYGVEFNLAPASGAAARFDVPGADPRGRTEGSPMASGTARHPGLNAFSLSDPASGLTLEFEADGPFDLYRAPILSAARSIAGPERRFQGASFLPVFRFALKPAGVRRIAATLRFIHREVDT